MFVRVANAIRDAVPGAVVTGEVYPPGPAAALASAVLWYIFLFGLALMAVNASGVGRGNAALDFVERNSTALVLATIGAQQLSNMLVSTGAFEVHAAGKLLHSKLETGTLPDVSVLIAAIRRMM